jgi:hypothetical protein
MAPKHKSRWLTGLIALALGLGAAGAAQGADKVRLRLNWMYYGSHAGFALGKDRAITPMTGSISTSGPGTVPDPLTASSRTATAPSRTARARR